LGAHSGFSSPGVLRCASGSARGFNTTGRVEEEAEEAPGALVLEESLGDSLAEPDEGAVSGPSLIRIVGASEAVGAGGWAAAAVAEADTESVDEAEEEAEEAESEEPEPDGESEVTAGAAEDTELGASAGSAEVSASGSDICSGPS
jgi:hypothetical protein